jgi:hypothetical protein
MEPAEGKGGDQGGDAGTAAQIKIEVDGEEKIMSTDDVQNLVNQASAVATNSQKVQDILKTVERYETDPSTYLQNAESAFAVMNLLMEKGIIDNKGELIEQKVTPDPDDKGKFLVPGADPSGDKTADIVKKALLPDIQKLVERVDGLEQSTSGLMRQNLKRDVQAKYPSFGDEEVARLVRIASEDRRKGLWEHAEELDKGMQTGQAETRKKYADEFKVDLDEFDKNKMKEQDADGGVGAIASGKKFLLPGRQRRLKVTDGVDPAEATKEHFANLHKSR